jgi:hypothetical protein
MITTCVKAGMFVSALDRAGRTLRRSLTRSSIEAFKTEYAFTRHLQMAGLPRSLEKIELLTERGVIPVINSDPRRLISAVWRVSEAKAAGFGIDWRADRYGRVP